MFNTCVPIFALTDSYKLSHPSLYPESRKLVAYGEFRTSYEKDSEDSRLIFFGIRYIVETYLSRRWTEQDLEQCRNFFQTHNAGYKPFPFPEELFEKFIKENDGYFPITLQALPEGSVIYPHTPVYQITAIEPYAGLVTYLESLLTMVWYPSTVATLSRKCYSIIKTAFDKSVDAEQYFQIPFKLHDFGFRGCTSIEQSVLGGAAHLLNFEGSDTVAAAYYVQYHWNDGKPVANSIPATEHSVMTSHKTEKEAILRQIELYGEGMFACVMDSYDYAEALSKLLPEVASHKLEKGGFLVIRPDSGDPIETVLMALRAGEKVFGVTINKKGYKVITGCSVIQGDGINRHNIVSIIDAVLSAGFSAQNVAFGMGGALLQKVNRDTMSFATKVSCRIDTENQVHNIAKCPKTDSGKTSLPGQLHVKLDPTTQLPMAFPKLENNFSVSSEDDLLRVVYDRKPLLNVFDDFSVVRSRIQSQWENSPLHHNPISTSLQEVITEFKTEHTKRQLGI